MSLIGILNLNSELQTLVFDLFDLEHNTKYQLKAPKCKDDIIHFLDFDLPELIIIDFSNEGSELDIIIEKMKEDPWLHNFGIVGLYDNNRHKEKDLYNRHNYLNILTIINYTKIKSHLLKNVDIINENKQIIFQWDLSSKLVENKTGSFIIDNDPLAGHVYAGLASTILLHQGYIKPETKTNLQIALAELILNGIEHGNCQIRFREKTEFLEQGGNIVDLISKKCIDSTIAKKKVHFEWEIKSDYSQFVIKDEGEGFDVTKYKEKIKEQDIGFIHGRGIKIARSFSSNLFYNKKGNGVTLVLNHEQDSNKTTPIGFTGEEIVLTNKGDILFKQNEVSDFVYYISKGRYSVFHGSIQVGTITPADIFLGEMSFLLTNKRSATVRSETSGKLIKISRDTFLSVMKEYPHYGIFLSKLLARKLVKANMWIAYFQKKSNQNVIKDIIV